MQTTPLPPPPRRATAFADAIRLRVRPRAGRPSPVEQVLRRAGRAGVVHQHRHAGDRVDIRLAVAFDLGGRWQPAGARTVWRTVAAPVLRGAPAALGRAAAAGHPLPAARIELVTAKAAATRTDAPGSGPTAAPAPAVTLRPGAVRTATQRRVSPVVIIHRTAVPAAASSVPAATTGAPQPASVRWLADVPPAPASAALTAADLPAVIDRVVGELDRRVAAARERRGWTA